MGWMNRALHAHADKTVFCLETPIINLYHVCGPLVSYKSYFLWNAYVSIIFEF